ncbi:hypothetical protein NDU88_011443 [Pleurodeles waltl]|uniref:Uncharacterized protein n=1 Tax=Pleurodeles waltl TaxID=8319 RepID=A0AAV7R1E0_PLEWA|nr:hypothetical protein NDU88_011443 [Pleurodeles waltl]
MQPGHPVSRACLFAPGGLQVAAPGFRPRGSGSPAAAATSASAAQSETARCTAPRPPPAIVYDPRRGECLQSGLQTLPGPLGPAAGAGLHGEPAGLTTGPAADRAGCCGPFGPRCIDGPSPGGAVSSAAAGMGTLPAARSPTSGSQRGRMPGPRRSPHLALLRGADVSLPLLTGPQRRAVDRVRFPASVPGSTLATPGLGPFGSPILVVPNKWGHPGVSQHAFLDAVRVGFLGG